jgi:flagellar basal body rod protein FlgG
MDVSLYQAAAAMNATERWQDLISENLASASSPGARKREISFSAVEAGLAPGGAGGNYVIPSAGTTINFQQGELRPTGNAMDFALEGKGFFAVQLPGGQTAYTRDGEFRLNAQGQLVTKQGFSVLTDSGGPVQLDPNNSGSLTISATGQISQGQEAKAKLQVVEFANPQQLTMINSGYFEANNASAAAAPSPNTQVWQGFSEAANTSPTTEMASLITAMRMFESNQKVLQMQSDRMSREISDLGNPS